MEATKILKTFTNAEYDIEAVVAKITGGFSVAIKDTDSGEYFPMAKIYQTEAQAMAMAEKAAA